MRVEPDTVQVPDTFDHDTPPVPLPPVVVRARVWPKVAVVDETANGAWSAFEAKIDVEALADAYVASAAFVEVMVQVPELASMVTIPVPEFTEQIPGVDDAKETEPVPLPPVVPRVTVLRYPSEAGGALMANPDWLASHWPYIVKSAT